MSQPGLSSSSSLDRKSLKQDDQFNKVVKTGFERFAQNRSLVIGFFVVLILGAGGALFLGHVNSVKEGKARDALFKATESLQKDTEALVKAEEAKTPPPA